MILKSNGEYVIMVIVDILHKYAHFLPFSHPYSVMQAAKIFFDDIFKFTLVTKDYFV